MTLARRTLKIALLIAMVALGWLAYAWLRDSPLVKVDEVSVRGLTTADGPAIRKVLTSAAKDMTTLHVDERALKQAVRKFPVVRSISASADFPSKLEITVHEYRPSAIVSYGGRRVAVAADGTLLPRVTNRKLPTVKVKGGSDSERLSDPRAVGLVALLSRAPAALQPKLERAYWGSRGINVVLRDGPTIKFGSSGGALAKWRAAASVLADEDAAGARAIDVRLPGRPVAGGFAAGEDGTASEALPSEEPEDGADPALAPVDPAIQDPSLVPAEPPSDPQL